jgi:hypothetical protein
MVTRKGRQFRKAREGRSKRVDRDQGKSRNIKLYIYKGKLHLHGTQRGPRH